MWLSLTNQSALFQCNYATLKLAYNIGSKGQQMHAKGEKTHRDVQKPNDL